MIPNPTASILKAGDPWSEISDYDRYQESMNLFSEFLSDHRKQKEMLEVFINLKWTDHQSRKNIEALQWMQILYQQLPPAPRWKLQTERPDYRLQEENW